LNVKSLYFFLIDINHKNNTASFVNLQPFKIRLKRGKKH